ncbi:hypothetical protein NKH18_12680 [Streptomyces sp. M10(2022)]
MLLTLGLVLAGVGLLLLRGLTPTSTWDAMLPGFIVCGLGVGIFNVVRVETTVSLVPPPAPVRPPVWAARSRRSVSHWVSRAWELSSSTGC